MIVDISGFFTWHKLALAFEESIDTGFQSLDRLGVYKLGALTVIAGYPGMGVSGFMISSMINTAKRSVPSIHFPLKNSVHVTVRKVAANFFQRDDLAESQMNQSEFIKAVKSTALEYFPMFFCDDSNLTVEEIGLLLSSSVERLKAKVVFIDDLSFVKGNEPTNSKDYLTKICQDLRLLAIEYNVSIVLGYTLPYNDKVENRPTLSMLRSNAEIEQCCQNILLLYRPEYFRITETEDGVSSKGVLEVIVAKNESGITGTINMKFIGKFCSVEETANSDPFIKI